jgi:hypothetical protein
VFLLVLLIEAITPLHVHIPPVWELCLTTLFTYGLLGFIDHERPVKAVWQTFVADLTTPRPSTRVQAYRLQPKVRTRDKRTGSRARRAS